MFEGTTKNAHTQEHVHFFMIGRRFAYWTGKALMDALRAIGYRFHYPLPISEASITLTYYTIFAGISFSRILT